MLSLFVQYPNREPVLRELVPQQQLAELREALEVFDDQHLLVSDPQSGHFVPFKSAGQLFDGCNLRVAVPRRQIFVSRADGTVQDKAVVWYPGAGAEQIESAIVKACGYPLGSAIEVLDGDVAVVISATIPNDSRLTAVPLAPGGGSALAAPAAAPGSYRTVPGPTNGQHRVPESPRRPGPTRTAITPTASRGASRAGTVAPRTAGGPPAGQRARSATPQQPAPLAAAGGCCGGGGYPSRLGTTSGHLTAVTSPSRLANGGTESSAVSPASQPHGGTAAASPVRASAPAPVLAPPGSRGALSGHAAGPAAGSYAPAPAPMVVGPSVTPAADEHCVHIMAGHAGPVLSLCTVGDVLFTGSQDCTIMIWDLNNLQYIGTLPGHSGPVKCMAATMPRKLLCSGSQDKTIKVWSLETFSSTKTFVGHTNEVNALVMLETPEVLLSGGEDRSVRVWDLASLSSLANLEQAHLSGIFAVRPLGAGSFVTASRDRTIKVWATSTWQAVRTLTPPHYDGVSDVATGPDVGRLFSASRDRSIRRWDARSLESDLQLTNAHADWITCLALSSSGASIFSGCRDATIKVWDQDLICKTSLTGHIGQVTALLLVDGHLFSASHDRTVRVWRVDQFEKC